MLVEELVSKTTDIIIIYQKKNNIFGKFEDFEDLYKGAIDNIPKELLEAEVRTFGAMREGVIDICVENLKKGD